MQHPTPQAPSVMAPPLRPTRDQLCEMQEQGFTQISNGPLPVPLDPFPVRVSIPLQFFGGCPFYLRIVDEDGLMAFLVMDDDVVDTLLIEMAGNNPVDDTAGYLEAYFWAEMLESGEMNFDTHTPCPEFQR